jgi:hypothetical protein
LPRIIANLIPKCDKYLPVGASQKALNRRSGERKRGQRTALPMGNGINPPLTIL